MKALLFGITAVLIGISCPSDAEPLTRTGVIAIAKSYAEYRWTASDRNVRHGIDRAGVLVNTPNAMGESGDVRLWKAGVNEGIPYKWGGFDDLASFNLGVSAGKAAGDMYTPEKRKKGGDAVSPYAVGIDCSGFISRCWSLPKKHSTYSLISLCRPLSSVQELRPGDIMNTEGGHVRLFAEWRDEAKTRALFYEAEPFSKVIAREYDVMAMANDGYRPLRHQKIRD